MFTHKSTDVWEDLALIMWSAGLQVKQVWSIATETQAGIKSGNYVQSTYNMVLKKRTGNKVGYVDFITPQVIKRVEEVITRMRDSQIETGLARHWPDCHPFDVAWYFCCESIAPKWPQSQSR